MKGDLSYWFPCSLFLEQSKVADKKAALSFDSVSSVEQKDGETVMCNMNEMLFTGQQTQGDRLALQAITAMI